MTRASTRTRSTSPPRVPATPSRATSSSTLPAPGLGGQRRRGRRLPGRVRGRARRGCGRAARRRADVPRVRRRLVRRADRGDPRVVRGGLAARPMSRDAGRRSEPISSRHNPRFRDARGASRRPPAPGARADPRRWRPRGRARPGCGRAARGGMGGARARPQPRGPSGPRGRRGRRRAVVDATPELLARLAYGERDDGIVAIVATPRIDLDALNLPAAALVAVVESVEKPGNLGAIVRSADGAGVDAVIAVDPASDPWSPNTIRASIGTVFSVPIAIARAEDAQAYLERHGVRVVAADPEGVEPYHAVDLTGPVAIVLGAEAEGLRTRGAPTASHASACRCTGPPTASTSRPRRPCSCSRRGGSARSRRPATEARRSADRPGAMGRTAKGAIRDEERLRATSRRRLGGRAAGVACAVSDAGRPLAQSGAADPGRPRAGPRIPSASAWSAWRTSGRRATSPRPCPGASGPSSHVVAPRTAHSSTSATLD